MIRLKEGFKGEKSLQLSDDLLTKHSKNPLIGNLYIRKMGFFPKVKYHYIQQELGCTYAMIIYCTAGRGWYQIAGKSYVLEKDQYIILPPNTPYSLERRRMTLGPSTGFISVVLWCITFFRPLMTQ